MLSFYPHGRKLTASRSMNGNAVVAPIYYAIGALAEPHRQQGLHQASEGFDVGDLDGIMRALIQTSTPEGLQRLRTPNQSKQASTEGISFGNQHWSLFQKMMNYPLKPHPIHYVQNTHQAWAHEHVKTNTNSTPTTC